MVKEEYCCTVYCYAIPSNLCVVAEREQRYRVVIRWWYQAEISLAGARETAAAAGEVDKYGLED